MRGASADTTTSEAISPSLRVILTVATVAVPTLTFGSTLVLKPGASTLIRYSTGSSRGAAKLPDSDVFSSSDSPVPILVIWTRAAPTVPPLSSSTVPLMPPLLLCAIESDAVSRNRTDATMRVLLIARLPSPLRDRIDLSEPWPLPRRTREWRHACSIEKRSACRQA